MKKTTGANTISAACLAEARQLMRDSYEAAEADAGFDGGEFSACHHAEALEARLHELATRRGVDPDDLMCVVFAGDESDIERS